MAVGGGPCSAPESATYDTDLVPRISKADLEARIADQATPFTLLDVREDYEVFP